MTESSTCVNCGSEVGTPYCSRCGQKNPARRINFLTLYTDFQSRIYGFDGMFPRTLRDLTTRPGHVALQFIRGNRVRYVGPVGYFFLTVTIFILLMQIFEVDFYAFSQQNNPFQGEQSQRQEMISKQFSNFVSHNMRIFSFLQIPITSFFAWLFFRKSGYNYLENAVLVFYVTGHVMWLSVLAILLYVGFDLNLNLWQIPLYWAFFAFACVGFYHGSTAGKIVKSLLVNLISYFTFTLVFVIAGLVYIFSNPEILKNLKGN